MITRWSLGNFKSIGSEVNFPLKPLTLFVGANSSGKSTVIQSILIVAQTVQSSLKDKPLIFNGPIVRLGAYEDIVHQGSTSNLIKIGFSIDLDDTSGIVNSILDEEDGIFYLPRSEDIKSIDIDFLVREASLADESSKLNASIDTVIINSTSFNSRLNKNTEEKIEIKRSSSDVKEKIEKYNLHSNLTANDMTSLEYDISGVSQRTIRRLSRHRDGQAIGVYLNHFLPQRSSIVYDSNKHKIDTVLESLFSYSTSYPIRWSEVNNAVSHHISDLISNYFGGQELLSDRDKRAVNTIKSSISNGDIIQSTRSAIETLTSKNRIGLRNLITEAAPEILLMATKAEPNAVYEIAPGPLGLRARSATNLIAKYFTHNIRYLGPLRDEPKPIYQITNSADTKDIGYRGEYTASVLELHGNTKIKYIPSRHFLDDMSTSIEEEEATLAEAVQDWIVHLGVASNISTSDKGKLGVELKIGMYGTDMKHDPIHVGVGVSQVLPILVTCLLSPKNSTLIFEQPELHLHPKVQTRLSDFFVSISKSGRQCLVETHSEYMVNRLRYISAVSKDDFISNNSVIFFVEKEGYESRYREIYINDYGVIEDWPKGFFDESEGISAKILRAGMQKRRLVKG